MVQVEADKSEKARVEPETEEMAEKISRISMHWDLTGVTSPNSSFGKGVLFFLDQRRARILKVE